MQCRRLVLSRYFLFFKAHRLFLLDVRDVVIAAALMALLSLSSYHYLRPQHPAARGAALQGSAGLMDCALPCMIPIIANAGGRIRSIDIYEGASVRQGDVLIQLETSELQERLATLRHRIHFMELEFDRDPSLRHASLAKLYGDLERTRLNLGQLTMTSPHEGQIIGVGRLHSGALLSAGEAVALLRIRKPTRPIICD